MELVTPGIGLLFWMLFSFSLLLFVLGKFAWKPILNSIRDRDKSIADALKSAEDARKEVLQVEQDKEKILAQARQEKEAMLRDAAALKSQLVQEARNVAQVEARKVLEEARKAIENERKQAFAGLKDQVALFSVSIAEQILRQKLESNPEQSKLIDEMLKDVNAN
jgi:F-type H+-transporting ATPase subunit b